MTEQKTELKKTLGYPTIIALTITSLMGTGLFFGAKYGAMISGNLSIYSWLILSIITVYVSFCFAELVSMYPEAGGVYEYSKRAFGRFPSFIVGWIAWIVTNIGTSVLIVAAIEYLIPKETVIVKFLICIFLILVLNYITLRGLALSSAVVIIFAFITLFLLLLIAIPGLFQINVTEINIFSRFPSMTDWGLIFLTTFFIIETFFGWEAATYMAEETKNSEKIVPKGLIIASIITVIVTMMIVLVVIGILPLNILKESVTPISDVSSIILGAKMMVFINIGIFLTLVGSAAGAVVTAPRLLLALARDKLFIEQLSDIHPKFRTPYKAIIFQTFISIGVVFIALGNNNNVYEILLSLSVPLALIMYISVLFSLVVLRYKEKDTPRYFKAPLGRILPIIVAIFYITVVVVWLFNTPGGMQLFKIALSFILFGVPIYLLLTFYYNPEAIIKVTNFFSYFNLFLEDFFLPKSIRKQMLGIFKGLDKKTILEFGSGVGSLTMHLAEAVGRNGVIFATELSRKNSEILQERLRKKGHSHVIVIHDEHQVNRVHPSIKHVDMVFSVGMMGYMQDPDKILKEINVLLPEHGKVCFLEYIDYFKLFPNPKWISKNEDIQAVFKRNGFSIRIIRVRSLFWNYLLVYGIKSKQDVPII